MKLSQLFMVLGVIGSTIAAGPSIAASSNASIQNAVPLTSDELYQLYSNRTWIWSDGAGYFQAKQRRFIAYSGSGRTASYGVGQWFLTGGGKVCFKAEWRAADGSAPALTCFSHHKSDGVIFQKREPSGEWQVFANSPVRSGDEVRKLRHGDYVGTRFKQVQASLSTGG